MPDPHTALVDWLSDADGPTYSESLEAPYNADVWELRARLDKAMKVIAAAVTVRPFDPAHPSLSSEVHHAAGYRAALEDVVQAMADALTLPPETGTEATTAAARPAAPIPPSMHPATSDGREVSHLCRDPFRGETPATAALLAAQAEMTEETR